MFWLFDLLLVMICWFVVLCVFLFYRLIGAGVSVFVGLGVWFAGAVFGVFWVIWVCLAVMFGLV